VLGVRARCACRRWARRGAGVVVGVGWPRSGRRGDRTVTVLRGFAILCASGILLVWIIYPALIGYLAARRRRGVGARAGVTDPLPSVSVIIATRDDVETIRARIADCLGAAHDPDRFEVIIGVDALSPHTLPDDLVGAANVRVVRGDQPGGKAATLNGAVRAARNELLLFTDAQQRFEAGAISRLATAFADARGGAA